MRFYQTQKFRKLQRLWNKRLKASGFVDIENGHGGVKSYDRRTIAFTNRERIYSFFHNLDTYLSENKKMDPEHRQILVLYSEGMHYDGIESRVHRSKTFVRNVIRNYKNK